MRKSLCISFLTLGMMVWGFALLAQDMEGQLPEPFKVGTFEVEGRQFVGAVIRGDSTVIDIAAANETLQRQPLWIKIPMAKDMKELIAHYDLGGLRYRVYQIVNEVTGSDRAGKTPHYVYDIKEVKILPPIMYPGNMLNAAVNYKAHQEEMAGRNPAPAPTAAPKSIPGLWERKPGDTRHNPYFFLKPSSAVIAAGESIVIPPERHMMDWECELAVVIGRPASHVSIDEAEKYIFGYTIEMDASDRRGREGDGRHGSDWLIGKGHDTFAPMGPFIVPKEFVKDPMNLDLKFTLNGKVMQDSNTSNMWHNVYELLHFGSNILTLQPGDVISTGSPSGVGAGRNPPIFMKRGDTAVSSIEGIGTMTTPIR